LEKLPNEESLLFSANFKSKGLMKDRILKITFTNYQMKNSIDPKKIAQFQGMREGLTLQAAIKESNRCLLCHDAPCSAGCPAGTDPGKFIRQIKFYNYKGAARTIRNNNILGNVCAWVCPVEKLCEKECSIKALENPININGLQRFALEYASARGLEPMEESKKTQGTVAVIGAGPAGMACAAALAKMDYDVSIFEKEEQAGGVPKWNIPAFRLPDEVLKADTETLMSLGVGIHYNTPVQSEDAVVQLLKKGFDAVFIACGLSEAFSLNLLDGYSNVQDYISFLRKIKTKREAVNLNGKNIAVIGGGSVAIDSAVSAKAAGASKVYLISLEHLGELPADAEEIELARLMNIIFKAGCQITGLVENENHITGLKGIETEWALPGLFDPANLRQIPGTEFSILADHVVLAIGTAPGAETKVFARGLKTQGKGIIQVNNSFETNIDGVFAGGDVVNGGATVVQAVGEGKDAAIFIDSYIKNRRS